jgi:exportin-2 (importin alpha re-exporter)
MGHFLTLLESDNKLLHTDGDDEPGILEELKSQICDSIGLIIFVCSGVDVMNLHLG